MHVRRKEGREEGRKEGKKKDDKTITAVVGLNGRIAMRARRVRRRRSADGGGEVVGRGRPGAGGHAYHADGYKAD